MKNWNIEEMTGYKPLTTLYTDFGIAEAFGVTAIKDTLKNILETTTDHKELTELVMVLNWKIWEHYETNDSLARVYNALWEATREHLTRKVFTKEQLKYYYKTVD